MKRPPILLVVLLIMSPVCLAVAGAPARARAGQNSIHSAFVSAISAQKYETALAMLHPKLSGAWTLARFSRDWAEIRSLVSGDWRPEITEVFSGNSPQGAYEQAIFRLGSDWRSISSVELIAMKVDGEQRIVRIHIRVPYRGAPPEDVELQTGAFVEAMLDEDFEAVQAMFAPASRPSFPPALLSQIRPMLGPAPTSTSRIHYRLSANSVWYDAVRLASPDDPMSFLELIMDSKGSRPRIISMSFRGRLKQ